MKAFRFYQTLKNDYFSLVYMGEFDDELTSTLMRIQETGTDEGRGMKKRLSYLIAECFQNVIRHSDADPDSIEELTSKMFMMRFIGGIHYLTSVNPIENENIEKLKGILDSLKKVSSEDIRAIYLEALGENSLSEKGGGGLGLIEMARKTKNPVDYYFEPKGDTYANFYMQLKLSSNEAASGNLDLEESKKLYHELLNDHVVMLRKGDFSQETILPLFQLFESNLQIKKEDLVFKKKSLYILIELLQNMNRHGVEINGSKEGLFLVIIKDGKYNMQTGNFIYKKNAEKLKGHLDSLNGLDKIELSKRYKEQLMSADIEEDKGAGLGIIEMFRQSEGEIIYTFDEVNEQLAFFSLSATL
ncbi:MAG: SiaB family protein kinase [Crocinitomicaceae bacterium]|nr:hypothetical protein [Crocinitomicaceae bacterium]